MTGWFLMGILVRGAPDALVAIPIVIMIDHFLGIIAGRKD